MNIRPAFQEVTFNQLRSLNYKVKTMSKKYLYAAILLITFPSSALYGLVGSTLWKWFAEPLGAPHIAIKAAMGLGLVVSLLRYGSNPISDKKIVSSDKSHQEYLIELLMNGFAAPIMILCLGYLYLHL